MQFQNDMKRITWALKPPTDGEFIKEQNDVSWTETRLFRPLKSDRHLFAWHGVLKRNQKIYKCSCLKESNQLWPFLSLRMNYYYYYPVNFIYL